MYGDQTEKGLQNFVMLYVAPKAVIEIKHKNQVQSPHVYSDWLKAKVHLIVLLQFSNITFFPGPGYNVCVYI